MLKLKAKSRYLDASDYFLQICKVENHQEVTLLGPDPLIGSLSRTSPLAEGGARFPGRKVLAVQRRGWRAGGAGEKQIKVKAFYYSANRDYLLLCAGKVVWRALAPARSRLLCSSAPRRRRRRRRPMPGITLQSISSERRAVLVRQILLSLAPR